MLGGVEETGRAVSVHAERDEGEESSEDDGRLHHTIIIQLAQKLSAADSPLVKLGLIHLNKESDRENSLNGHLEMVWTFLSKAFKLTTVIRNNTVTRCSHLHAQSDVLQHAVHHVNAHVLLIRHQAGQQVGHAVDAVVFDVPDVDHTAYQITLNVRVMPR